LLEYTKIWEKASKLDVKRIKDANEEIIEFLKNIKEIKIK
jgi:hypothetical protein